MKLLAIDTATEACSAALYINAEVSEKYELAPRRHAELILTMVDGLLVEADIKLTDLDGLAFGRGPGAFTGVRMAAGVIQGLAFAADLPVVPVSTLAAMAQSVTNNHSTILSAIDARMGEIYWALFSRNDEGLAILQSEEQVCKPAELSASVENSCFGVGSGWGSYSDILSTQLGDKLQGFEANCFPKASNVLTIALSEFKAGRTVSAAEALPVYLRNKVTG